MYCNYIQLSGRLIKAVIPQCQLLIKVGSESQVTKRWAGHSKWSNIKHTKQQKDREKGMIFTRLCDKIRLAVKDGGGDINLNSRLRFLLEESRKINMPSATFQNAVKTGLMGANQKPNWLVYTGPGGMMMGFEVIEPKVNVAVSNINHYVKKVNLKYAKHPYDLIVERGILVSEPLKDVTNAYDKAVEDAIEVGIQEVEEGEDNMIIFECPPNSLDVMQKKLSDKGYNIQSASIELEFTNYVTLSEEQMESFNDTIKKLQDKYSDVLRVVNNVDIQ